MSKRVLVTGAGGFIGANLVRSLLARGDQVYAFSYLGSIRWRLTQIKNKLRFYNVEIHNSDAVLKAVEEIKPEQVFHLAQYGGNPNEVDNLLIRRVIIDGTSALFDACAKVGSVNSIVYSGTSSEYGAKSSAMKEDMLLEPDTAYGCAKAWATLYAQYLAREKNVPITILRLVSVYGPWESATRFIPTAILSCFRNMPIKIFDIKAARGFIFVDDIVRAYLLAADNPKPGEVFNIGFGRQMTLLEAAEIIMKYTGTNAKIEVGGTGRSFDKTNKTWEVDISKAENLLGWQPMFSQEEGIAKTVKWYRENKNLYPTI